MPCSSFPAAITFIKANRLLPLARFRRNGPRISVEIGRLGVRPAERFVVHVAGVFFFAGKVCYHSPGDHLMTRIQSLCMCLLAASAVACAPAAKVGFDYDPSANFNAYHTYEWMEGEQEKTGNRSARQDRCRHSHSNSRRSATAIKRLHCIPERATGFLCGLPYRSQKYDPRCLHPIFLQRNGRPRL